MFRSPSHVYLRQSGYYFRLTVPEGVRDRVGKHQIRHPLFTRSLTVAKHRARYLAFRFVELFTFLQAAHMKMLQKSDIEPLIQKVLRGLLDFSEETRIAFSLTGPEFFEKEPETNRIYEADARNTLATGNYELIAMEAEALLKSEGFEVDKNSIEFKRLCHELAKVRLAHAKIEVQRSQGNYDAELPTPEYSIVGVMASGESSAAPKATPKVSEIYALYEKERLKGKKWRETTQHATRAMFEAFVEIMGDLSIGKIDKEVARDFKARLQLYPVNRHKDPRYRELTLSQIAGMARVDTLSVTSLNNRIAKIGALFGWATKQGYLASNPFGDLTIDTSDRAKDDVLPFDRADLEKIFHSPLYRERAWKNAWQFWLPLLGLFTGARIEELCQLHLEDIREIEGVWCFDINNAGQRQLKNKASMRIVPIHPELTRIGLLSYVEDLRRKGKIRLFPDLGRSSGKFSHYPSKWFGDLKRGLGFPSRKKVFHSFRHTVIAHLTDKRAQAHEIKMLVGHETGSETFDRYGKDATVMLYEVVCLLRYDVDISHIAFGIGAGDPTR